MNKLFKIGLIAVIFLGFLTACGNNDDEEAEEGSLVEVVETV